MAKHISIDIGGIGTVLLLPITPENLAIAGVLTQAKVYKHDYGGRDSRKYVSIPDHSVTVDFVEFNEESPMEFVAAAEKRAAEANSQRYQAEAKLKDTLALKAKAEEEVASLKERMASRSDG